MNLKDAFKKIFAVTENSGYDDEILFFVGKNLYNSRGYIDFDYDKVALKFQELADSTDVLYETWQVKHKIDRSKPIYLHAHCIDPDATSEIKWWAQFRFYKNGETPGSWSDPVLGVKRLTSQTDGLNIYEFAEIDISSLNMSDLIDIKFYREDDASTNAWLKQADFHVRQKNITGSFFQWEE